VISPTCPATFRVAAEHDIPTCAFCISRVSIVSTLTQGHLRKNVYHLQTCSKGNGLLCLHQKKNIQTFISSLAQVVFLPKSNHWIPVFHGTAFSIFQHADSRTTEVDELLFYGSLQIAFKKTASHFISRRYKACFFQYLCCHTETC